MNYDWDPAKEAINQQKHGISFIDATAVFDDPHHIFEDSTRPEHGERRGKAIGKVGERFIVVIYTDRQESRRIISARRPRKNERAQYDQSKALG